MRKTALFFASVLFIMLFSFCNKLVEEKRGNLLMEVITNGRWQIEAYNEGSTILTESFSGYSFQFRTDGTVSGYKDDTVANGTWQGDIDNYSIYSNFPTAQDPLKKLNGLWKITDSDLNNVQAEMDSPLGKNILHLRKAP